MDWISRWLAGFSQERMTYIKEVSKVNYQSKDGKEEKVFDALEWVAAMCSHVPNIVIPFPLTHKPNFLILHPRKSNVLSSTAALIREAAEVYRVRGLFKIDG